MKKSWSESHEVLKSRFQEYKTYKQVSDDNNENSTNGLSPEDQHYEPDDI